MNLSIVDHVKGKLLQYSLDKCYSFFFLNNSMENLVLRKENCLYTSIVKQQATQQNQNKSRNNVLDFSSYFI